MRFLAKILANSLGILLSHLVIPGFSFGGSFKTLLVSGLALALASIIIRPVLKLLSLPLIIITFGIFLVVINMIVLNVVDYAFDSLAIAGLGSLFWATLLVSIVNALALALLKKKEE